MKDENGHLIKPNRVYEVMTKMKVYGHNVRIWSSVEDLNHTALCREDLFEARALYEHKTWGQPTSQNEVAEHFSGLRNVAAVEVVDDNGQGVLIYPDWK